jgi:hypothetical protein
MTRLGKVKRFSEALEFRGCKIKEIYLISSKQFWLCNWLIDLSKSGIKLTQNHTIWFWSKVSYCRHFIKMKFSWKASVFLLDFSTSTATPLKVQFNPWFKFWLSVNSVWILDWVRVTVLKDPSILWQPIILILLFYQLSLSNEPSNPIALFKNKCSQNWSQLYERIREKIMLYVWEKRWSMFTSHDITIIFNGWMTLPECTVSCWWW